jgi:hypothetical protein
MAWLPYTGEGGLAGWGQPTLFHEPDISGIATALLRQKMGEREQVQQAGQQVLQSLGTLMQQRRQDQMAQALLSQGTLASDPLVKQMQGTDARPSDILKAVQEQRQLQAQQLYDVNVGDQSFKLPAGQAATALINEPYRQSQADLNKARAAAAAAGVGAPPKGKIWDDRAQGYITPFQKTRLDARDQAQDPAYKLHQKYGVGLQDLQSGNVVRGSVVKDPITGVSGFQPTPPGPHGEIPATGNAVQVNGVTIPFNEWYAATAPKEKPVAPQQQAQSEETTGSGGENEPPDGTPGTVNGVPAIWRHGIGWVRR